MILQSLSKAIREQNYYAVLLEFVIVIAGVVIGFQIQAWNAARAASEAEQIYLARLHEDMRLSVCRIAEERELLVEWNDRARKTLRALLAADPSAVDDTGFELIASTRIQVGTPHRATLNELVGGGQMNLITSPELRAIIATVDAELTALGGYIQLLSSVQGNFSENIHRRLRPTADRIYEITYDFEVLAGDETFINSLGQALRVTRTNAMWLERMIEAADRLRIALAEALGRDPAARPDCSSNKASDS